VSNFVGICYFNVCDVRLVLGGCYFAERKGTWFLSCAETGWLVAVVVLKRTVAAVRADGALKQAATSYFHVLSDSSLTILFYAA
jgi:hypothetical protein